jgi:periplasmic protein TonB
MISSCSPRLRLPDRKQLDRIGPLALIILLHLGLFYSLQRGLPHPTAAVAAPKELFASLIAPEPAIRPAAPQPSVPTPTPATQSRPPKTVSTPPVAQASFPIPSPPASSLPPPTTATAATASAAAAVPATVAPMAAPAPVAVAAPKTITSGVEYLLPPQPEYPALSRRLGEQGKVMLRILVNEKGRPERVDLQQSSGSVRLDEAARQAVLHALFKPHIEDGKAVAVYAIVPIKFELNT